MSYNEDEDVEEGFKIGGADSDEPPLNPEEMPDFGLDDEDPDKDR